MTSTCSSPSSSGYGTLSKNSSVKNIQKQQNSVFGSSTMMSKEDYERDRTRWQQKLDDTAKRLADAEIINSEMNQIKAELNKKIVEMERIQRPLIDQNRRLTERNRILQNEIKKCEQKLCHSQDDFFTLKDDYERLMKDNQSLKERRAFPEKLEELDRYRNQVLEYSKCITALRQAGLEKDRRYDLLVQKFKRLRKCISSRKNGENEEDRQSSFGGSDCSAESSISLNTITEDLNEALDKDIQDGYQQIACEGEQLQRTLSALKADEYGLEDEQFLRDQLICAQTTITQQQMIIEQHQLQSEGTMELLDTISRLQDQIVEQRAKMENMEAELIESKEMNDLLEFQLLENKENMKHEFEKQQASKETKNNQTMTEVWISEEDDCAFLSQMPPFVDFQEICNRKCDLIDLRRSASLNSAERQLVHEMLTYIEHLENRLLQLKTDTEQIKSEYVSKETENAAEIQALKEQVEKSHSKQNNENLLMEIKAVQRRELELEGEKQALNEEVNAMSKEMGKLRYLLQQKDEQLTQQRKADSKQQSRFSEMEKQTKTFSAENTELRSQLWKCTESLKQFEEILVKKEEEMKLLEKENARLQAEYGAALNEIQRLKDDIRPVAKTDLERRFEEYRYRLSCALETMHEYEDEISKLKSQMAEKESKVQKKRDDAEKEELEQIREYTEQLEEQFTAQVGIIEALKRKVVQQKVLTDFLSSITDNGELSLAKIEDKLARFRLSQQDEGNCQLADAIQRLLRLMSNSCGYGYKVLPSALS